MNESSGGKNTQHVQMKHGIHAGDSAVGNHGLMPNSVKEETTRMGRGGALHRIYANMPNEKIGDSLAANPKHYNAITNHLANRLSDKFGGDESKMAYSWNQGSNLTNDHFKEGGGHSKYQDHDYVKKYHNNRQQNEKTPQKPEQPL